jgi:hypothetical protein
MASALALQNVAQTTGVFIFIAKSIASASFDTGSHARSCARGGNRKSGHEAPHPAAIPDRPGVSSPIVSRPDG